jgi:hypothetical protein
LTGLKDSNESRAGKAPYQAEDRELIARLATDLTKRENFSKIAKQLREMAADLREDMAIKQATEQAGGSA